VSLNCIHDYTCVFGRSYSIIDALYNVEKNRHYVDPAQIILECPADVSLCNNYIVCIYCRRYPVARAVVATFTDWMTVYGWPLKSLWNAPVDMYYYAFPDLDMSYEVINATTATSTCNHSSLL
jgi:hypothetical protein